MPAEHVGHLAHSRLAVVAAEGVIAGREPALDEAVAMRMFITKPAHIQQTS